MSYEGSTEQQEIVYIHTVTNYLYKSFVTLQEIGVKKHFYKINFFAFAQRILHLLHNNFCLKKYHHCREAHSPSHSLWVTCKC